MRVILTKDASTRGAEMQFVCECANTVRNWALKRNKQTKQTDFKRVTKLLVNVTPWSWLIMF